MFLYSRIGGAVVVATPAGVWRSERRRCRSWRDGGCCGETTTAGLCAGHLIDDVGKRLKVAVTTNVHPLAYAKTV